MQLEKIDINFAQTLRKASHFGGSAKNQTLVEKMIP
jgi:hypothetical protein